MLAEVPLAGLSPLGRVAGRADIAKDSRHLHGAGIERADRWRIADGRGDHPHARDHEGRRPVGGV